MGREYLLFVLLFRINCRTIFILLFFDFSKTISIPLTFVLISLNKIFGRATWIRPLSKRKHEPFEIEWFVYIAMLDMNDNSPDPRVSSTIEHRHHITIEIYMFTDFIDFISIR